jgi:hypothetical protein
MNYKKDFYLKSLAKINTSSDTMTITGDSIV